MSCTLGGVTPKCCWISHSAGASLCNKVYQAMKVRYCPCFFVNGLANSQLPFKLKGMAGDFADSGEPVRIPITDVFDLHSVPPRDVKAVVEAYLEEAHNVGLTALRIIHGRGIGVQREMVRAILARTDFVVSYSDAPAEAGGWGATIVTLRG